MAVLRENDYMTLLYDSRIHRKQTLVSHKSDVSLGQLTAVRADQPVVPWNRNFPQSWANILSLYEHRDNREPRDLREMEEITFLLLIFTELRNKAIWRICQFT